MSRTRLIRFGSTHQDPAAGTYEYVAITPVPNGQLDYFANAGAFSSTGDFHLLLNRNAPGGEALQVLSGASRPDLLPGFPIGDYDSPSLHDATAATRYDSLLLPSCRPPPAALLPFCRAISSALLMPLSSAAVLRRPPPAVLLLTSSFPP